LSKHAASKQPLNPAKSLRAGARPAAVENQESFLAGAPRA